MVWYSILCFICSHLQVHPGQVARYGKFLFLSAAVLLLCLYQAHAFYTHVGKTSTERSSAAHPQVRMDTAYPSTPACASSKFCHMLLIIICAVIYLLTLVTGVPSCKGSSARAAQAQCHGSRKGCSTCSDGYPLTSHNNEETALTGRALKPIRCAWEATSVQQSCHATGSLVLSPRPGCHGCCTSSVPWTPGSFLAAII